METTKLSKAKKLAYFAILTAIVLILQFTGSAIKIGAVTLNFVLIPIVLCGILLDWVYGALMGFIVGLVVLLSGVIGMDGFTNVLFAENPLVITLACILKTTLAGAVGALVYKVLHKKHEYLGTVVSAASVPVVNTGIFILGMLLMKNALVKSGFIDGGTSALYGICVGIVGINFVFEFLLNIILAPAIYKVIQVVDKSLGINDYAEGTGFSEEQAEDKNEYLTEDKTNEKEEQ